MVRVENISKVFPPRNKGEDVFIALQDVNFEVEKEEFFTIIGPSGCGKSTLVRLLAGLEQKSNGRILLNGEEVKKSSSDVIVVWQEFALMEWRTVTRNIEFGLELAGVKSKERRRIAKKNIGLVGLKGFENSYPNELSGGMKQRVGLARALALEPQVLIMDEPLGALDAQTRMFLQNELLRIWDDSKHTVIFVTHSLDEAIYLSDRIAVFTSSPGTIKEIYEVELPRPRNREMKKSKEFLQLFEKLYSLLEEEFNLIA